MNACLYVCMNLSFFFYFTYIPMHDICTHTHLLQTACIFVCILRLLSLLSPVFHINLIVSEQNRCITLRELFMPVARVYTFIRTEL